MTMTAPAAAQHKIWQWTFMALAALALILMPALSIPHGQTGDEWSLILYGHDIYDYFFNSGTKALNYDGQSLQLEGLHYYGGLYDFTVTFLHKKLFTSCDELTFRHIINALIGAGLFIYTGLIAKHFGGWRAGVLAFLFIALSPRILGESMNNPKDIPFAFANVFFLYYLLRYIRSFPAQQWKYALLMGLGFGLAAGFRIGGILMIPYTVLFLAVYYIWDKDFKARLKTGKKGMVTVLLNFAVTFVLGYVIMIMFWPWALQEPLSRPMEALSAMTNREIPLRMLFNGEYIMNTEVPTFYTFKWIFISSPVLILALFLASIVLIAPMAKRFGKTSIFFLLFILFFPVLYAIYKHSTLYDTWRHFFFVYPGMVILAALCSEYLLERFADKKGAQYGVIAVIALGMLLPALWIVRSYPNEYVYFNELEGGAKGAYGVYDFDYYQNSGKQATQWIKEHATPKEGKKIIIGSNLSGLHYYFQNADSNRFSVAYVRYNERDEKDWDYYVTYSRYIPIAQLENNTWPPANAVHVISADGVPISAVLQRKTKADLAANAAMQRNQPDSAIALFQQSIQTDPGNEMVYLKYATQLATKGQMKEALDALDQAIKLDNSNPGIYNIQMQIYKAVGDRAGVQRAQAKLSELQNK